MFSNHLILKVLFSFILTASLNVNAATASFNIISANTYGNAYILPQSFGYQFTPLSDIAVSSLGFFDYLGNGLGESHTVGIFDSAGNLLTSAVVSSGTGNPLDGAFRYTDIAPVTLSAGGTYTAAALFLTNADVVGYADVEDALVNPAISLGSLPARYIFQTGTELQFPTETAALGTTEMYYGPNFKLTAVPLPGALIMFGSGIAGLTFLGLGRKNDRCLPTVKVRV